MVSLFFLSFIVLMMNPKLKVERKRGSVPSVLPVICTESLFILLRLVLNFLLLLGASAFSRLRSPSLSEFISVSLY